MAKLIALIALLVAIASAAPAPEQCIHRGRKYISSSLSKPFLLIKYQSHATEDL